MGEQSCYLNVEYAAVKNLDLLKIKKQKSY